MLSGYLALSEEGRRQAAILYHFSRCGDTLKESLFCLDFSQQGACPCGLAVGRLPVYVLPMVAL